LIIAAEAMMGRTAVKYESSDYYNSGTVARALLENFRYGRTHLHECPESTGRMADPEEGCDGLSSIFIDHIYSGQDGKEWEFTAAISGGHTVGSASIEYSGYDGWWGSAVQGGIFNNDYFKSILLKGWYQEKSVDGDSSKNQFRRIDQGRNNGHKEKMLSTDMCLAYDANPDANNCGNNCNSEKNNGSPLLAQDHNCCAWIETSTIFENNIYRENENFEYCGTTYEKKS
jgi:hypothetical protein